MGGKACPHSSTALPLVCAVLLVDRKCGPEVSPAGCGSACTRGRLHLVSIGCYCGPCSTPRARYAARTPRDRRGGSVSGDPSAKQQPASESGASLHSRPGGGAGRGRGPSASARPCACPFVLPPPPHPSPLRRLPFPTQLRPTRLKTTTTAATPRRGRHAHPGIPEARGRSQVRTFRAHVQLGARV